MVKKEPEIIDGIRGTSGDVDGTPTATSPCKGRNKLMNAITIGLADDGKVSWSPAVNGNLLVTGGAGCGKTWWLTHTLIPALDASGTRVCLYDGYVRRGYDEPMEGTVPVEDPMSVLNESDAVLIIDHVNPGIDDELALIENMRDVQSDIPIILSVQLAPEPDRWDAWCKLHMLPSHETGLPRGRVGTWSAFLEASRKVLLP